MNKRIKKKQFKKTLQIAKSHPEEITIVSENEIIRKKLHQEVRQLMHRFKIK